MAKKSKGKQAIKKDKRRSGARREERRFIGQASNGLLVGALGAVSALLLGAGAWGFAYAKTLAEDEKLRSMPSYLVAAGAVLLGIAIWLGTLTGPAIRVGAPGVAAEKGDLRRMPWWAIDKVTFDPDALAILVAGTDEANVPWTLKLPLKTNGDAIGWLIKEALERIPRRVQIEEETLDKLPPAGASAGEKIELEPLQVVGKRCAVSERIISFEPDGRVCARCERVYVKTSVPKKCKCGNSLLHLRPKGAEDGESDEVDSDEADDPTSERATADETAES
jgi:hypothetical protein